MKYPSRSGIHGIAIAMLGVVSAESRSAESAAAEPGVSSPPRLHQSSPEELGRCYAATARRAGSEGRVEVVVTIEADGSVSEVKLPPGIEPWQEETAQCVIRLLRFDAAMTNGVATRSNAVVPLNLSLPDELAVEPPQVLASSPEALGKCYSRYARRAGEEGRMYVNVTVAVDGSLSQFEMPPGVEAWQEETARCVLGILKFRPGTVGGVPVVSRATMPINFSLEGSGPVEYMKLISTASEFEDANRSCYPPGSSASATPQYRFTVTRAGKATRIKVVESSGDEKLDEAGICVVKLLRFQPAMRGREPVESSSVLPVDLAPPK